MHETCYIIWEYFGQGSLVLEAMLASIVRLRRLQHRFVCANNPSLQPRLAAKDEDLKQALIFLHIISKTERIFSHLPDQLPSKARLTRSHQAQ